ncbi:MAG: hypothetical protein ACXAC6_11095 [Candidatus Hodarchaeales archaeon]|jgi:hypothetical protein
MASRVLIISKAALKTMFRQKSIIFSCFILPVLVILSTWWITADIPMIFNLENGKMISSNMINVHIVTGGLTAVAITAGLFGFILTADSRRLVDRLRLMGYPSITINLGWFTALLSVLLLSSSIASLLTVSLYEPVSITGVFVAITLTTIIYSAFGYFLGILYPRVMEGTLIVLLVSFIDLMLLSNPMGENLYLISWTKLLPGFWPTQMALEAAFIGFSSDIFLQTIIILGYIIILVLSSQFLRGLIEAKSLNVFRRGVRT